MIRPPTHESIYSWSPLSLMVGAPSTSRVTTGKLRRVTYDAVQSMLRQSDKGAA